MASKGKHSSRKLFWILLLTTTVLMSGFAFTRFILTSRQLSADMETRAMNVAHRIGNSVAPSVWDVYRKSQDRSFSEEVTSAILDAEFRDPFVLGIVVYGNFGHVYMGRFREGDEIVDYSEARESFVRGGADMVRFEPIKSGPMTIGNVRVYLTARPNETLIWDTLILDAIESVVLSALIVAALFFILRRALIKPMQSLGIAKLIVDSLREAVVVTDRHGLVVDVNPFFCRLFDMDKASVLGKPMPLRVGDGHGVKTLADVWLPESDIRVWSGESSVYDHAGKEIRVYGNVAPVFGRDGSWEYTVTVLQDIEDLRHAEEELRQKNAELVVAKDRAEASSRAKDDFLSIMSHELRTPLNPILGFGELIQSELEDPELKEQMSVILSSGSHLLRLIESILEYTKLERDEIDSGQSVFDYRLSCQHALKTASIICKGEELAFSDEHLREGDGGTVANENCLVVCDQTKFEQVLLNLVTNAAKFTPSGSVVVRSRLKTEATRARLRIEVIDTGIGISEENRGRIFQAFTQVDSTLTRKHEGIGLGLAISMKLVGAMGGEMACESELGVGSTFWFEVPVGVMGEEDLSALVSAQVQVGSKREGARNVLVVEDEPSNRLVVVSQLEKLGYGVTCANNGQEAIDEADKVRFSCILMDLQMAGVNGFTAAESIRQSSARNKETPIVAFTAHASAITREECTQHCMNDFLAKPYSFASLEEKLAFWQGKRIASEN